MPKRSMSTGQIAKLTASSEPKTGTFTVPTRPLLLSRTRLNPSCESKLLREPSSRSSK